MPTPSREIARRPATCREAPGFEVVTREALDVACAKFGVDPDPEAREAARRAFLELPPLAGPVEGVADLGRAGVRLAALSNGSSAMIEASVRSAGLDGWFEALLSADAARAYKPLVERDTTSSRSTGSAGRPTGSAS